MPLGIDGVSRLLGSFLCAPPASNLGAGRATKKEKRWATPTGLRAGQSARMPRGCQNAIKAYTDTDLHAPSRKSFSFLPVEPAEIAGLLSLPPLDKMALSLHQSVPDRSSTVSPTNHGNHIQLALRTDGPRLFWMIELPRAHTDSLSISLSRLIATLAPVPVPGRADTTNPFGSSFSCSLRKRAHLPWSLHEPRQPCPPGDPDWCTLCVDSPGF